MEGTYPILIDGEERGTLTVMKSGLMTVFEAECEDTGGVLRLSVYGGSEGYLGVMAPVEGVLKLKKSMSRSALKLFPGEIIYAGPAGMEEITTFAEKNPEKPEKPEAPEEPEKPEVPETPEEPEKPEKLEKPEKPDGQEAPGKPEEPEACMEEAEEEDTIWHRGAGGALTSIDREGNRRIAVPLQEGTKPIGRTYEIRAIEGVEYVVFLVKSGKIN